MYMNSKKTRAILPFVVLILLKQISAEGNLLSDNLRDLFMSPSVASGQRIMLFRLLATTVSRGRVATGIRHSMCCNNFDGPDFLIVML